MFLLFLLFSFNEFFIYMYVIYFISVLLVIRKCLYKSRSDDLISFFLFIRKNIFMIIYWNIRWLDWAIKNQPKITIQSIYNTIQLFLFFLEIFTLKLITRFVALVKLFEMHWKSDKYAENRIKKWVVENYLFLLFFPCWI